MISEEEEEEGEVRARAPLVSCKDLISEEEEDEAAWDSMSEVSESPDVGDVQYIPDPSRPLTREDAMLARIDALKDLLNEHPLVPRDPRNRSEAFVDMASGVRLPDVHCAFRGCVECKDIDSTTTSAVGFLQWEV